MQSSIKLSSAIAKKQVARVLDANFNRLKEGLRVCEDISRFVLCERSLTAKFKHIRHAVSDLWSAFPKQVRTRQARDVASDVGKTLHLNELKRKSIEDIFFANIQRSKESLRVLEEFAKLFDIKIALKFKAMRYELYESERRAIKGLSSVSYR